MARCRPASLAASPEAPSLENRQLNNAVLINMAFIMPANSAFTQLEQLQQAISDALLRSRNSTSGSSAPPQVRNVRAIWGETGDVTGLTEENIVDVLTMLSLGRLGGFLDFELWHSISVGEHSRADAGGYAEAGVYAYNQ
ncbi:MAG: hypothetical protein M1831_006104 [Alyxoria varia]|nr:MAG: hypothetical protein M1831_006104 [Alyxoria varia]